MISTVLNVSNTASNTEIPAIKTNPIVSEKLKIFSSNLKEISKKVQERTKNVEKMVFDERTLVCAKNTRSELNKEFLEFENQRKILKKEIMKPYDEFNFMYEEYVSKYYRSSENILKKRIKEIEYKTKDKKREELLLWLKEYGESINLERIATEKEIESLVPEIKMSESVSKLKKDIKTKADEFKKIYETAIKMENGQEIWIEYKRCKNFPNAVKKVKERGDLVKEMNKMEERLRREKEWREAKEAREAREAETRKAEESKEKRFGYIGYTKINPAETKELTVRLKVTATREKLRDLKNWMIERKFKFE